MMEGWKRKPLMEVATVSTGKWDANHAVEDGEYRFYTCAYEYLYSDTKRFSGKCLILPGNGANVGEVFYYDGEFDAYQRTYVLSDIKIDPEFLHYHMLLYWRSLGTKKQFGSATNYIKIGNFKDYKVEYPPLPEQHRIVSILDHCFEAIDKAKANAERNLQNAKELFESYLQGVFEKRGENWKNVNIDSVCEVVNGGTPKTKVKEYWNGDVNWITPADLGKLDSVLVNETSRKITELGLQKSSAKLFKENSVILSTRAPIGHLAINTVPMSTNQGCRGLVPNKNLNTWFLYYFLKGNIQLLNDLGTGATFLELSSKALKSVIIPLPPLKDQIRLVSILNKYVEASQNLETHYQKRIDDLEELKKSILQKAFAGELKTEKMVEETPLAPISESVCCEAERI